MFGKNLNLSIFYNEEVSLAFDNRSFTDYETELDWLHDQLIKCTSSAFNKCYPNQSDSQTDSQNLGGQKNLLNINVF